MGIQLVIRSGPRSGEAFTLERERVRIGSDPRCEVAVPESGLEPHSVTVELSGGQYRISNRMARPISVAGRAIAPNQSDALQLGEEIDLAGELVVSLEAADQRSSRSNLQRFAPELAAVREEPPAEPDLTNPLPDAAPPQSKSANIQLIVTVFCFAMVPLMFLANALQSSSEGTQPSISLEDILGTLKQATEETRKGLDATTEGAKRTELEATEKDLQTLQTMVDQIRLARASQLRGQGGQANTLYDRVLREILLRQRSRPGGAERDDTALIESSDTTPAALVLKTEAQMAVYIKRRRSS